MTLYFITCYVIPVRGFCPINSFSIFETVLSKIILKQRSKRTDEDASVVGDEWNAIAAQKLLNVGDAIQFVLSSLRFVDPELEWKNTRVHSCWRIKSIGME